MHITARSESQPEGKGNGKHLAESNMDSPKTRKAYSCNKQDLLGPEWKSELSSDATVTRNMRQLIRGYGPLGTYPLVNCFTVLFFGIQDKRLKINSRKTMRKTLKWCTRLKSFLHFVHDTLSEAGSPPGIVFVGHGEQRPTRHQQNEPLTPTNTDNSGKITACKGKHSSAKTSEVE